MASSLWDTKTLEVFWAQTSPLAPNFYLHELGMQKWGNQFHLTQMFYFRSCPLNENRLEKNYCHLPLLYPYYSLLKSPLKFSLPQAYNSTTVDFGLSVALSGPKFWNVNTSGRNNTLHLHYFYINIFNTGLPFLWKGLSSSRRWNYEKEGKRCLVKNRTYGAGKKWKKNGL
jgi:hypothetical protein